MNGNDANAVPVRKTLELSDDLIVAGVAVSLASGLPNLLHGVNDNQLRVGVFLYEILKLLVKNVSDFVCCRCKMQAGGIRHAVHHKHPTLDSLEIILQCKVQNRTLMDFIAPQPSPCADMVGKLRYQKRFSDFGCSCEDICPGVEQTVYDGRSALVDGLIQLCHGNRMKITRIVHASDSLTHFLNIFLRGIAFAGFMWYALVR